MRKQGFRKFHKIKQTGFGTELDEYHKKKPRISFRFLTWCLQDGDDGDFFIKLWNRGGRTGFESRGKMMCSDFKCWFCDCEWVHITKHVEGSDAKVNT